MLKSLMQLLSGPSTTKTPEVKVKEDPRVTAIREMAAPIREEAIKSAFAAQDAEDAALKCATEKRIEAAEHYRSAAIKHRAEHKALMDQIHQIAERADKLEHNLHLRSIGINRRLDVHA